MFNGLFDRLRSARHIWLFAAVALACLLALVGLKNNPIAVSPDRSALEARLEGILSSIEGAGRVRVMITQSEDGAPTGAVVVANEVEDMRAYLNMQSAVRTLLDIDLDRIRIIGRAESGGET